MPRRNAALPPKTEDPVVWYAFFSERLGREYYYNPSTGVSTWILPDDFHVYPNSPASTPQPSEPHQARSPRSRQQRQQKRRPQQQQQQSSSSSSPHLSRQRGISIPASQGFNPTKPRKKGSSTSYLIPRVAVVLLSIGLGVILGHTTSKSETTNESCPTNLERQVFPVDTHKQRSAMAIPQQEPPLDSRAEEEEGEEDDPFSQVAQMPLSPSPQVSEVVHDTPGANNDDGESRCQACMKPKSSSESAIEAIEVKKEDTVRNKATASDSTLHNKQPRRLRKCMVPFSHLVSRECRQLFREKHPIDVRSIIDAMMQ